MKTRILLSLIAMVFAWNSVKANGLQATNISMQSQNITNQTWQVRFNLTWNNSWKDGINHDAAWIFIKFRVGNGPWTHAVLDTNGYSIGTGTAADLKVSPERTGALIYRQSQSSGTFSTTAMELRWNYGQNNVQNNDLPQVRVFAIEMVQIPEGPFAIGDGDGSSESANALGVANDRFYVVTRELSPPLRADAGFENGNNILRIKGDGGVDNNGDAVIDNAAYPIGYNSYFVMKYKITQEQYADFLSTLLPLQSAPRYYTSVGTNRYNIQTSGGLFFTSTPDRACNFISFEDGLAYADWACLRPMTETEYEKACRGPLAPVLNEYPWGSTTHSPSYLWNGNTNLPSNAMALYITNSDDGTEFATNSNANFWHGEEYQLDLNGYSCTSNTVRRTVYNADGSTRFAASTINNVGPLKVGIFVDSLNASRQSSGVSYYGVVELSVNLSDVMYNITSSSGRTFSGVNGDGTLTSNGTQNVSGWPTSGNIVCNKGYFTTTQGGSCSSSVANTWLVRTRVSARYESQQSTYSTRYNFQGFRCARTQWW